MPAAMPHQFVGDHVLQESPGLVFCVTLTFPLHVAPVNTAYNLQHTCSCSCVSSVLRAASVSWPPFPDCIAGADGVAEFSGCNRLQVP